MPWKKIFCAAMMYMPSMAFAQMKTNKESKPLAENIAAKTSPMSSTLKPISAANAVAEASPTKPVDAKVVPQAANRLTERGRKLTGDMYIPIAGELAYFGKNNDYVLNYTKNYYATNFRHFSTIKQRGVRYFKIIDKTFDRREVPLEMKYLSVIESALNNKALSPVGASGPWQFMPTTGQFMGLVVNEKVDERNDWNKSTNAAAKYVNYLYDMLNDWLLVVAAYNSGPRPILNAIKKTGSNDFFVIKKYLPAETQNHVMAFIATATVMERMENYIGAPVPKEFDWKWLNSKELKDANGKVIPVPAKPKNPLMLRFTEEELKGMAIVKLTQPIDLDVLAITIEEDRRKMGKWNFDYFESLESFNKGETKQFLIRIPKDKLDVFLEKKSFIEKQKVNFNFE